MIIEIGTNDFRTFAGKKDGIFIEPVKYYFDRLPECKKENIAISNKEGVGKVFYLTDDEINMYQLPSWIRGCCSMEQPHPTVVKVLNEKNIDLKCIHVQSVPIMRIRSIIDKYKITTVDYLKIDTEGHDSIILNDYLDTVTILPKMIQFENNILSDKKQIQLLISRLQKIGYQCVKSKFDIICTI